MESNLTPAARRDLELMRQGVAVNLRYGPYIQLLEAGLIVGEQDHPMLVEQK